jgi:hypothetical protein
VKVQPGVKPASFCSSLGPRPLSLVVKLHGPQGTLQKAQQDYYIHPARRHQYLVKGGSAGMRIAVSSMLICPDEWKDVQEDRKPWKPNSVLLLGPASAGSSSPSTSSAAIHAAMFSKPLAALGTESKLPNNLSSTAMQAVNVPQPSNLRSQLTLASKRYLPPPDLSTLCSSSSTSSVFFQSVRMLP